MISQKERQHNEGGRAHMSDDETTSILQNCKADRSHSPTSSLTLHLQLPFPVETPESEDLMSLILLSRVRVDDVGKVAGGEKNGDGPSVLDRQPASKVATAPTDASRPLKKDQKRGKIRKASREALDLPDGEEGSSTHRRTIQRVGTCS